LPRHTHQGTNILVEHAIRTSQDDPAPHRPRLRVERPRTHPSSAARSSTDSTNSAFGRPVRATPQAYIYKKNS
ncbi:hypothetical protein ACIHFC_28450, partial [Streptomyces sp. NPDC052013]|uniref:hypothetical protein n=1 Tax=Streptomyces sp. NPDC052013 TaxID=3365679 RepID=UPI0037CE786B